MPNVVGLHLDKAKDALHDKGYEKIRDIDRKEGRSTIVDSNWVVVDQSPAGDAIAGTDETITLGVIKVNEVTPTTTTGVTTTTATPPTTVTPMSVTTTISQPSSSSSSTSYANCTDARAAGVTPLHRYEPGYSSKLDRDNDGIACE